MVEVVRTVQIRVSGLYSNGAASSDLLNDRHEFGGSSKENLLGLKKSGAADCATG